MKLKCKICGHVVDTGVDPVQGAILMVTHVQTRHAKLAFAAVNAIAAYVSTFFFEPLVSDPVSEGVNLFEQYKETKKTLLHGFREWCKAGIK
jgi:fructose-1,6-bisphosphatase/sedoheptulose 1,7-bisphosphatase-like protein